MPERRDVKRDQQQMLRRKTGRRPRRVTLCGPAVFFEPKVTLLSNQLNSIALFQDAHCNFSEKMHCQKKTFCGKIPAVKRLPAILSIVGNKIPQRPLMSKEDAFSAAVRF